MKFKALQENLRKLLWGRIERRELTGMKLAQQTGWFPVGGASSVYYDSLGWFGKVQDTAWHLTLPVLVLGTRGVAGLMRQMRGNMLDVLGL